MEQKVIFSVAHLISQTILRLAIIALISYIIYAIRACKLRKLEKEEREALEDKRNKFQEQMLLEKYVGELLLMKEKDTIEAAKAEREKNKLQKTKTDTHE